MSLWHKIPFDHDLAMQKECSSHLSFRMLLEHDFTYFQLVLLVQNK